MVKRLTFFENGRLESEMTMVEKDGLRLRHEQSWYANGSKDLDYYKHEDRYHGEYVEFWENGFTKKRGRFIDGKQDGYWYEWSNMGVRLFKSHYRSGKLHGPYTGWNSRGELAAKGAYREGREAGEWILFPTYERETFEKLTYPEPAPAIE